ncbi:MAG: pilus assembly protein PilP [Burkholderiaceae bacterium]
MIDAIRLLVAALVAVAALSACGDSNDELRQWMAETRKEMKPVTTTLAEPKTFEPFLYHDQTEIDPFDPSKVTNALKALSAKSNSGIAPDLSRRKEPLEAYPIDTITMVGTLERPNLRYALLRANGLVYQIKVGNYIGMNFGIVTHIDENEVALKEIVQDAAGEWVERTTTLQLQENKR